MFYCNDCATTNDWPRGFEVPVSHGRCELCGEVASCFDVPSKCLPSAKPNEAHTSILAGGITEVVVARDQVEKMIFAMILPIADRHVQHARVVARKLRDAGADAGVDERSESLGRKIRDAEIDRVPLIFIVGDVEVRERTATLRTASVDQRYGRRRRTRTGRQG